MIAAVPPCTPAVARAAIAQTHVREKLVDQVLCAGGTLAVTFASGGTAGDVSFVLFRRTAAGWRAALVQGGYKLGLFRAGGDVVWSQPVYRKTDPNCCPSGGFDHVRYHWNGTRFTVARSWHTKTFEP